MSEGWSETGVSVRRLIQMLETCSPHAEVRAWYDGNNRLAIQRLVDHGNVVVLCEVDDWNAATQEVP